MMTTLPEELLRLLREHGMPPPPLPPDLVEELEEEDDLVFAAETSDKFLHMGLTGHGLQSRRFQYALRVPGLDFQLSLPYGRAFGDPKAENEDLRRGFALARLCLAAVERGLARPGWKGGRLGVDYDERDCSTRYLNTEGEAVYESDGLDTLLDVLETSSDSAAIPETWVPV